MKAKDQAFCSGRSGSWRLLPRRHRAGGCESDVCRHEQHVLALRTRIADAALRDHFKTCHYCAIAATRGPFMRRLRVLMSDRRTPDRAWSG